MGISSAISLMSSLYLLPKLQRHFLNLQQVLHLTNQPAKPNDNILFYILYFYICCIVYFRRTKVSTFGSLNTARARESAADHIRKFILRGQGGMVNFTLFSMNHVLRFRRKISDHNHKQTRFTYRILGERAWSLCEVNKHNFNCTIYIYVCLYIYIY